MVSSQVPWITERKNSVSSQTEVWKEDRKDKMSIPGRVACEMAATTKERTRSNREALILQQQKIGK